MADKVPTTDREKDIAAQIRGACVAITDDLDAINEYKDSAKAIGDNVATSKLAIYRKVAQMSDEGKWLPGEISAAVKYASTAMNNAAAQDDQRTPKSLAVFMSEMNTVAHPKVRNRLPVLMNAVEEAWNDEALANKADPDMPMPIKKWASRKAHAIMNVLRAVKNDDEVFTCAADVKSYAEQHDPDHDAVKIEKRMESIAKALKSVYIDFADADVGFALQYVEAIKADKLIASRKAKFAAEREIAKEHRNLKPGGDPKSKIQPITPVVTPVATQKPVPEAVDTNEHTMVEGAFDLDTTLNDTLNDREAIVNNEIQKLLAA